MNLWDEIVESKTHALVEASAGTGKTYTILKYVLALLDKGVDLEQILLVTFTEKATGELKDRIRAGLEERIQGLRGGDSKRLSHFERNLAAIDSAPISTIHGFCLRTLQTQSLEAGLTLKIEMAEDQVGLKKHFRRLLRSDLSLLLPDFSPAEAMQMWALALAENPQEKVHKIALQFLSGDLVLGESLRQVWKDYQASVSRAEQKAERLQELNRAFYATMPELLEALNGINDSNAQKRELLSFRPLLEQGLPLAELIGQKGTNKWTDLLSKSGIEGAPLAQCEIWSECHQVRSENIPDYQSLLKNLILAELARRVAMDWNSEKLAEGSISFDDMIRLLALKLQEAKDQSPLLSNLRRKYKFGIVDEFQDTDGAQWGIFRRLFLESPEDNLLLLVGDPKQAIYRFRGADLGTYLRAKSEMQNQFRAKIYKLDRNFRSTPAQIQAYNTLFHGGRSRAEIEGIEHWFQHPEIVYALEDAVQPGSKEGQLAPEFHPDYLQNPLRCVDLSDLGSAPARAQAYALWCVQQIMHLLDPEKPLRLYDEELKALRPVRLSDIAVLARSRPSGIALQNALDQAGIPWDLYKEKGLFQSDECLHLILLLEAVLDQGQRLSSLYAFLLTPFVGLKLADLEQKDSEALGELLQNWRLLLAEWAELCAKQKWSKFLREIQRKTNYWSVHYRGGLAHGERALANLMQLFEQCLHEWSQNHRSLRDVILRLRNFREDASLAPEQESFFELAHSRPKIQFLTMHSSKGLEFPVVFHVMKGDSNKGELFQQLENEQGQKALYFSNSSQIGEQTVKECTDLLRAQENARLFYVSFTRASLLQYAPILEKKGLGAKLKSYAESRQCLEILAEEKLREYAELRYQESRDEQWVQEQDLENLNQRLQKIAAQSPVKKQYSFTKISPHGSTQPALDLRGGEDEYGPEEPEVEELSVLSSLPPGPKTGLFWHGMFEDANWQSVLSLQGEYESIARGEATSEEGKVLQSLLDMHLLKQGLRVRVGAEIPWQDNVNVKRRLETLNLMFRVLSAEIVDPFALAQRGFQTQVKLEGLPTFRLADLEPVDRKAELDFLCPIDEQGRTFVSEQIPVRAYLTGSLDLVFRHQGRYYVLDWKSNFLAKGYGPSAVALAVQQSSYDLQAAIYSQALDRWLSGILPAYDREEHFGGVIYAFVRGMGPKNQGLWIRRPDPKDWESGFEYSLGADHLQNLLQKEF